MAYEWCLFFGSVDGCYRTGEIYGLCRFDGCLLYTSKPISNVLEAMQGTTPGLVIQQGSSTPGSVPSINTVSYTHLDVYKRQLSGEVL